jgi:hypothetical protein
MGVALVGLLGVVVGAIISGGATYVMARRSEATQARTGARLLETELRTIAGSLGLLLREPLVPGDSTDALTQDDLRAAIAVPAPRLWHEYRAVLAGVLSSEEWYAVSRAYENIELLRTAATSGVLFTEKGQPYHVRIAELLVEMARDVAAGAQAVAARAGNPEPEAPVPTTLRDFLVVTLKRKTNVDREA